MDFVHFLSSHMLDPRVGGKRLYKGVVEQALQAEKLRFRGVGIPEHHLLNLLLIPSPLQMAVKIAAHTSHVKLMTSVCQLPLRDMRVFAGVTGLRWGASLSPNLRGVSVGMLIGSSPIKIWVSTQVQGTSSDSVPIKWRELARS